MESNLDGKSSTKNIKTIQAGGTCTKTHCQLTLACKLFLSCLSAGTQNVLARYRDLLQKKSRKFLSLRQTRTRMPNIILYSGQTVTVLLPGCSARFLRGRQNCRRTRSEKISLSKQKLPNCFCNCAHHPLVQNVRNDVLCGWFCH